MPEKNDSRPSNSTRNEADRQAQADYLSEALQTGKDPIPTKPPDWAKDIPSPKKDDK